MGVVVASAGVGRELLLLLLLLLAAALLVVAGVLPRKLLGGGGGGDVRAAEGAGSGGVGARPSTKRRLGTRENCGGGARALN